MNVLVLGPREDVAGFALAGIEGVVCTTKEQVGQAIASAAPDTLVIVWTPSTPVPEIVLTRS